MGGPHHPRAHCEGGVRAVSPGQREPRGAHSRESSPQEQHLSWMPMAGRRQRTPEMPSDEEQKAGTQPANRLSLRKRRQVGHRQPEPAPQGSQSPSSSLHGDRLPRLPCPARSQAAGSSRAQMDSLERRMALPRSRGTREETTHLPALLPPPGPAAAPGHTTAAQAPAAGSACRKLPPLPAAPSVSAARGRETATSPAASGHPQLVPPAWGTCGARGTAGRVGSWRPAPPSPTAYTSAVRDMGRSLASEVLSGVLGGKWGPSQQPVERRDWAQGTAVASTAARLAPGRDTGPGHWGQVVQRDPAMVAGQIRGYQRDRGTVAQRVLIVSIQMEPQEEQEKSLHARREPSPAQPRSAALPWQQESTEGSEQEEEEEEQRFSPIHSGWLNVRPRRICSTSSLSSELYQGEDITTHSIWVNPSVPELLQDPHAAPEGPTDTKTAAPALAGAPEDEGQLAAQEETKPPGSPPFGQQATAAQAGSQVPAPHSPTASAVWDAAQSLVSEVLDGVVAAIQRPGRQPAEPWGLAQSMGAVAAAGAPAAPRDPGHQEEPGALAKKEKQEDRELSRGEDVTIYSIWVNPSVPELFQDPHAAPQGPTDTKTAAPALAGAPEDEGQLAAQEETKPPGSPPFGQRAMAAQAGSQVPAPHSPTASAVRDAAQSLVSEVLDGVVAAILRPGRQPAEPRGLARSMGAVAAAGAPAAPRHPGHQAASEHSGDAQPSSGCSTVCQDDPGIAAPPHAPAGRRRPSLFRRALGALHCACIADEPEQ